MPRGLATAVVVLLGVSGLAQTSSQQAAPPAAAPAQQPPQSNNLGADANGNPLRLAFKTGHVSNYDEEKVPPYTLPDPLVLATASRCATPTTGRSSAAPRS